MKISNVFVAVFLFCIGNLSVRAEHLENSVKDLKTLKESIASVEKYINRVIKNSKNKKTDEGQNNLKIIPIEKIEGCNLFIRKEKSAFQSVLNLEDLNLDAIKTDLKGGIVIDKNYGIKIGALKPENFIGVLEKSKSMCLLKASLLKSVALALYEKTSSRNGDEDCDISLLNNPLKKILVINSDVSKATEYIREYLSHKSIDDLNIFDSNYSMFNQSEGDIDLEKFERLAIPLLKRINTNPEIMNDIDLKIFVDFLFQTRLFGSSNVEVSDLTSDLYIKNFLRFSTYLYNKHLNQNIKFLKLINTLKLSKFWNLEKERIIEDLFQNLKGENDIMWLAKQAAMAIQEEVNSKVRAKNKKEIKSPEIEKEITHFQSDFNNMEDFISSSGVRIKLAFELLKHFGFDTIEDQLIFQSKNKNREDSKFNKNRDLTYGGRFEYVGQNILDLLDYKKMLQESKDERIKERLKSHQEIVASTISKIEKLKVVDIDDNFHSLSYDLDKIVEDLKREKNNLEWSLNNFNELIMTDNLYERFVNQKKRESSKN